MFLKIFGILDLLAGILFFLVKFNIIFKLSWILAFYLIGKGIVFFRDFASIIDLICGIFFIMALFGHYFSINWIFVLWLLQKGFFSFFTH